jgi:hypothetical protein
MTEYLKPFISAIDEAHQITHLCVPYLGEECISEELKKMLKDNYSINITIVPFDSSLFPQDTSNGLYLLIDCMNQHRIMATVGRIQNRIGLALTHYKKNEGKKCLYKVIWTLLFLSNRQHKWEGKLI